MEGGEEMESQASKSECIHIMIVLHEYKGPNKAQREFIENNLAS